MTSLGRVLVVDDEQEVRALLQEIVAEMGYAVRGAPGGAEALETIAVFEPDVVLLDLQMPGMSGVEVLDRVRAQYPSVRVIIVTANEDLDVALRTLANGAIDYIRKPFTLDAVERSIGAAVAVSAGS